MTAILRTAASSSQAIGRFVRCAYSNFSLSRASASNAPNSPERVGLIAFAQMLSARSVARQRQSTELPPRRRRVRVIRRKEDRVLTGRQPWELRSYTLPLECLFPSKHHKTVSCVPF